MLLDRKRQAGITRPFGPHLFRHTFADSWLRAGGAEGDVMRLAGWRTREMLDRYGPAAPTPAPARRTTASRPSIGSPSRSEDAISL